MSYDIELLPRGRVDEILRQHESQDADSVVLNPGPSVPGERNGNVVCKTS